MAKEEVKFDEQTETEIQTTEVEAHETALQLKSQYDGLVVADDESRDAMLAFHKSSAEAIKEISEHIDPAIKRANAKHKKLTGLKKNWLAPFEEIKKGSKSQVGAYDQEQQRIAQEKAREEARKQAEELKRQQDAEADALREAGREQEAKQVEQTPLPTSAGPVVEKPDTQGVRFRTVWSATIYDVKELFIAYADNDVDIPALDADDLASLCTILGLNKIATAQKKNLNIPGVRAVSKRV